MCLDLGFLKDDNQHVLESGISGFYQNVTQLQHAGARKAKADPGNTRKVSSYNKRRDAPAHLLSGSHDLLRMRRRSGAFRMDVKLMSFALNANLSENVQKGICITVAIEINPWPFDIAGPCIMSLASWHEIIRGSYLSWLKHGELKGVDLGKRQGRNSSKKDIARHTMVKRCSVAWDLSSCFAL